LLGLAAYLFLNQDDILPTSGSTDGTSSIEASLAEKQEADQVSLKEGRVNPKPGNAAAEGLSRFYENLYGSDDEELKVRNNVIYLPDPEGDLIQLLEAQKLVTRPLRKNWQGKKENRPFRRGETLFQKLSDYSGDNGLQVMWWINRDFIVKDPFRVNKDIIKTAFQIGQAVEGHFHHGISTYFCYNQRTIVIIENEKHFRALDYLNEECSLLKPKGF